eukprot:8078378-Alexandrium_andersonii.AAC.1
MTALERAPDPPFGLQALRSFALSQPLPDAKGLLGPQTRDRARSRCARTCLAAPGSTRRVCTASSTSSTASPSWCSATLGCPGGAENQFPTMLAFTDLASEGADLGQMRSPTCCLPKSAQA